MVPHACSGCLATHLSPSIHVVVCEGWIDFVQEQSRLAAPCFGDNVAGHREPGLKYLLEEGRAEEWGRGNGGDHVCLFCTH